MFIFMFIFIFIFIFIYIYYNYIFCPSVDLLDLLEPLFLPFLTVLTEKNDKFLFTSY